MSGQVSSNGVVRAVCRVTVRQVSHGVASSTGSGGGSAPFNPSVDFSDNRNSQYLTILFAPSPF